MTMKSLMLCLFIYLAATYPMSTLNAQQEKEKTNYYDWANTPDVNKPAHNPNAKKLSLIRVVGNKFVNARGDTILFRGVAIADPDKLDQQGRWNRETFVRVKEYGAMIVRIPVHPAAWRMRTPTKYLQLLDQAVDGARNWGCISTSTGTPSATLAWSCSKTQSTLQHARKRMNSGGQFQYISREITRSPFMNSSTSRHSITANWGACRGANGRRSTKTSSI